MAPALLATAACGTRQRQRDQGHDHAAVRLLRRAQSDQTSPASDGSGLCPAVAAGAALMYSPPRRGVSRAALLASSITVRKSAERKQRTYRPTSLRGVARQLTRSWRAGREARAR